MKKNLKKSIVTIIAAALMSVSLLACGGSDKDTTTTSGSNKEQTAGGTSGYAFKVSGGSVYVNQDMEDALKVLGEDYTYFESESCAFQGMDKVYTYSNFVVSTYPKDGKDYILSINLKNDLVETAEGVGIGSPKESVTKAYSNAQESGTVMTTEKEGMIITFILEDDTVSAITYSTK